MLCHWMIGLQFWEWLSWEPCTLNMRALRSFARWGTDRPLAQCHIPEEQISQPHSCENHNTNMVDMLYKACCGLVVAWVLSGIFLKCPDRIWGSPTPVLCLGVKWPGHEAGQSPPYSARVKERVERHLSSLCMSFCRAY